MLGKPATISARGREESLNVVGRRHWCIVPSTLVPSRDGLTSRDARGGRVEAGAVVREVDPAAART
ncbi:hypothetical protein [Brachybacterium sacelli]|uniref:hypothetical protein n=1 Tax=Brachybacterium sacelli TaxID=173364 RepID=UPI00360FFBFB